MGIELLLSYFAVRCLFEGKYDALDIELVFHEESQSCFKVGVQSIPHQESHGVRREVLSLLTGLDVGNFSLFVLVEELECLLELSLGNHDLDHLGFEIERVTVEDLLLLVLVCRAIGDVALKKLNRE